MDSVPSSPHEPMNLNETLEYENQASVDVDIESTEDTETEAPELDLDLIQPCSSADLLRHQMELKMPKHSCVEGSITIATELPHNDPWFCEVDDTTEDLIRTVMFIQCYPEVNPPDDPPNPAAIEAIKTKILRGETDGATEVLKWHYPKILEASSPSKRREALKSHTLNILLIDESRQITCVLYALAYQAALEMVRQRNIKPPPEFAEVARDLYNDFPWLQQDIKKFQNVLDSEDPWKCPWSYLMDLSRRKQTVNFVFNQIAAQSYDDKEETHKIDEIVNAIQEGDISLAMAHVNRHYYVQIRDRIHKSGMLFELAYQHAIELVRWGKAEQARGFAETCLNQIAASHFIPWRLDELNSLKSLINSEVPSESPNRDLLELSRRQLIANDVLDKISNIRNNQMPNVPDDVPNMADDENDKDGSSCSSN